MRKEIALYDGEAYDSNYNVWELWYERSESEDFEVEDEILYIVKYDSSHINNDSMLYINSAGKFIYGITMVNAGDLGLQELAESLISAGNINRVLLTSGFLKSFNINDF